MPGLQQDVDVKVMLENHTVRLGSIEKQLAHLSTVTESIQNLSVSVNKLAINMENMLNEQKAQGERIRALENEPADNWKLARKTIITAAVSTVAGALVACIIIAIAKYLV